MTQPSLTKYLAHLVADTDADAIPVAIRSRAKISLLHNLVVGLAGRSRSGRVHLMAQRFWGQPAEATLLHDGARVSVEGAAFANAALINARSQDDTHPASTSHPGSPTMAAGLAMAEMLGRSGAEFLAATVLGYEVLCRIGRDFDEQITARGFRAAAVLGGFGAATASARLMCLPAGQVAHALGLAANLAGGLAQVWREGSAEAPLQMGFAARNGISVARVASFGAEAAMLSLEGPAGFFRSFAGAVEPATEARSGLGEAWQFDEVTVKPFPVCAILQGPVGVLLDLLGGEAVPVEQIRLSLNPYEAAYPGIDCMGPFASSIATKMSAQFSLGLASVDGRVTLAGLDRVADPDVLSVAQRVQVMADPGVAPRHCRLSVQFVDGRVLDGAATRPAGQPGFDEAARFAHGLAGEIGAAAPAIEGLIEAVMAIEAAPSLVALINAARACVAE